jgi:polysaccharide biosynthesis protein PslG
VHKNPGLVLVRGGAAVATALLCLGTSYPCRAQRQLQFGVGTHISTVEPTRTDLATLDATFRDDVQWTRIERTPGHLEYAASFSSLDQLVTDVLKRNKKPLIVLPGGNKIYDGGGQVTSSEAVAAYARYAQFVARQLKGRVTQLEIWNEWEEGGGAPKDAATKGDPVAYANLLRATYPAVKAGNPDAVVIGGAIAGSDAQWVQKFVQAGGLQYLDAFSIHPYVHCNAAVPGAPSHLNISSLSNQAASKSGVVQSASPEAVLRPIGGTPEQSIALVDQLKTTLDQLSPGRTIPIYVTEIGWPTSVAKCGVPDTVAAAYLQRFMLLAAARPYVAGVWWYDLFDDGADPSNPEHRFGLVHQDHTPKAAYNALAALKPILESREVPIETLGTSGEIVVSGKGSDGKEFYSAWLPTNSPTETRAWSQGTKLSGTGFRALVSGATLGSSAGMAISAVPTMLVHE